MAFILWLPFLRWVAVPAHVQLAAVACAALFGVWPRLEGSLGRLLAARIARDLLQKLAVLPVDVRGVLQASATGYAVFFAYLFGGQSV